MKLIISPKIAYFTKICNFTLTVDDVQLLLGIFGKKTPKRMWLCMGMSPLLYGLRTWSKHQKTQQVL